MTGSVPKVVTLPGFRIKSAVSPSTAPYSVQVSNSSDPTTDLAWRQLGVNFASPQESSWFRKPGYETVVFKDKWGASRAFYLQIPTATVVEVTFLGMQKGIRLHYTTKPPVTLIDS